MNKRVIETIRTGIEKGESSFIFYGKYIHDWFLYDLYNGIHELKNVLKKYFLLHEQCDYYIYCKNEQYEIYSVENGVISECSNTMFKGKSKEGDASDGLSLDNDPQNDKNDVKENDIAETGNSASYNAFLKTINFCNENKDKTIAFMFEDYEWTTGLYKSSNDDKLAYIEKVKELCSLKNTVVIITLEEPQMLKKYNFQLDGKNCAMLAAPAAEEIHDAFLRRYFRKYKKKEVGSQLLEKMNTISEAISSGEKSLKEALNIFDKIMVADKGEIKIESFEKAVDKIIEEKVFLEDVILDEATKSSVVAHVDNFLSAEDVSEITKGMILTGPPGTGKTYLVKALANEKNCYFMNPSLADLKAEYVGQTSPKIKRIFQKARANAPTIIFIDEADTVFPGRDNASDDSDSFSKDMVNQFLVEMDGMLTGNSRVFIVAATNRPEVLDSAIKSRLGKPIQIPLPAKEERELLFDKLLAKEGMSIQKYGFLDEFLDKTNRMSGRDIKNFVDSVRKLAQKEMKAINEYETEEDAKRLLFESLNIFENDMVNNIQASLGVKIYKPNEDSIKFKNVIGCKNVKNVIKKQMRYFDNEERKKLSKFGIKPNRGILLYGPPGNGKSMIAEAAANEYNLYFMKITSDTFTKARLDQVNQILINIFDSALQLSEICGKQRGVLLFFDEFDSLVSKELLDPRVRGTMLTQLDDTKRLRNQNSKILFVAATNFYERLDEAVVRTGRIDDCVEMCNPTIDEGIEMVLQYFEENKNVEKVEKNLAEKVYNSFAMQFNKALQDKYVSSNELTWKISGRKKEELEDFARIFYEGVRPSASDLKNCVQKLIASAYYQNSFTEEKDGKSYLKITEENVLNEFG